MRNVDRQVGRMFKRGGYRQLLDSMHAILWIANPESKIQFVSKEAESILGYPVERWLDEPTFRKNHIHPEDREQAVIDSARSAQEGKSFVLEYRMISMDGSVVWFRDFIRLLGEDGKPSGFIGVMIDITGQKNAEEQLSSRATIFAPFRRICRLCGKRSEPRLQGNFMTIWVKCLRAYR